MPSASPRSSTVGLRQALAAGASCLALLAASVGDASASDPATPGSVATSAASHTVPAAKAKKRCRTVRVKKRTKGGRVVKRGGKPVFVKRRKCTRPKARPLPTPMPAPSPYPLPNPEPAPAPAAPRIDQILGWSTAAEDPDTPPVGLVPHGGTLTSCPNAGGLSVYLRRSGFTTVGLVSHVWRRDGVVIASGTNSSALDGAFRHTIVGSPLSNGMYEITWSYGGATIGRAVVTRNC